MFDFSNIFFVLIAAAVLIVRTALQVKRKQDSSKKTQAGKAPPKPAQAKTSHKISVHFEDDDDPGYFKTKAPARNSPAAAVKTRAGKSMGSPGKLPPLNAGIKSVPLSPPEGIAVQKRADTGQVPAAGAVPPGLPYCVNRLPPLKQAVVMAEILGTPKGLL